MTEPTDELEAIRQAATSDDPGAAILSVATDITSRSSAEVARLLLERLRLEIQERGDDPLDDVVLNVLDVVTGWCSPHQLLKGGVVASNFRLLDVVELRRARPDLRLEAGTRATVVDLLDGGLVSIEVEVVDDSGRTTYLGPIGAADVQVVWRDE